MSSWGWPEGLAHNLQIPLQILQTRFHYKCSTSTASVQQNTRFLCTRCLFKHRSATALLQVKQGYWSYKPLLRRTYKICCQDFFLRFAQHKKTKKSLLTSYIWGQLLTCPQPRFPFFWFMSSGFCKWPISFEVLAPVSLVSTRKPNAKGVLEKDYLMQQKQYQQRTTLRTWPWWLRERDAEWSAPTIAHLIHGASVLLGM